MDYYDQLLTVQWLEKRTEILKRDLFKCHNCNNSSFEDNLNCGIAITLNPNKTEGLSYFSFCNVNLKKIVKPQVFLKISNSLQRKLFNKINRILWVEFVNDLQKMEADIYFIRSIPNSTMPIILQQLQILNSSKEKVNDKAMDKYPRNIEIVPECSEVPKAEKIVPSIIKIDNLNPGNDFFVEKDNIYYSPGLFELRDKLPICFAPKLNVHHKVYRQNKLAWEYPDDDLITLCWSCHEKIHKNQKIPFYNEFGTFLSELTPCNRCFGAGWFPQYKHVENGICFECRGKRFYEFYN